MVVAKLQFRGTPLALLLLPMVLLPLGHSLIHSVPFQTVQDCTKKQHFDISRMACRFCGDHQQKSKDGTSCACQPGYKLISNKGGPFIKCAKCPALHSAVTQDGWSCIRCPHGVILDNEGKCRCPVGYIMVERHVNGAPLQQVQCHPCSKSSPSFTMPDHSAKHCIRCHETFITTTKSCDCKSNVLTGGLCFHAHPKTLTTSVVTNIIYSKNLKVSSAWFVSHLKASAIACLRFANLTACQALGNMCVMTMNSINSLIPYNDACGLYQTIFKKTIHLGISHSINSWRKTLPWLYYDSHIDGLPSRILHQEPFQTLFHFKSSQRMELQFIVARYDVRGNFLNWAKATGGILQLCPDTLTKLNAAYIFGLTYRQQCTLPVSMLLSKYRAIQFYDLYVLHKGEHDDDQLHPVAVRNLNLQYNGKFVNKDDAENDWYLTRRIFLVDTLAGREDNLNRQPKVIRVANDIKIRINLVPNSLHGKIFPPVLIISYVNIKIQNPEEQTVPISFSVEYKMDLSTANQNTEIALGFLCGLSTICSMLKTASWKRRIGSQMIDIQTILKFLLFYAGDLANAFFLVTFGTGLYWLIFFKGQRIVSVLLPTPSQEVHFIFCVVSAFALKLLQLLHKLGIQLTVDIFFIDWERPKGKIVKSVAGGGDIKTAAAPVSIWRTYFVANEWNNIQTIRKINPIFQIFVVLFFLEVVGFANLTSMSPYSNFKRTAESDVVPPSRILRFGMASGIWLTVGVIQVVFCTGIYERFVEDRISQFIDVCSISNISVMIFSHRCFGYYIHGRSVHGHADTNMEEMNLNLKREADNLCGQRGLIPNTEIETFQIFTTSKIREQYDKIREPIHWSSRSDQLLNHADDSYERKMKAYNTTNKFLGSFIDHAIHDMDYIVQDKLLLERIIGMELHEPIDKTIFYNDEKLSFTDVLYYGNESTLLIFDTLFFCVVDLAAQNFILAAFLTYVQQKVIQFIRLAIGRKNLAIKTLVDERFLL
ncbi:meckelin isoform X1 [Scyliorhinus canicula]|uniref:meckelin isoform X1 n=1 Tax=Scyliorhinus canicula TaxID=7830 RepID=UPI0018F32084|nr:meckelin isoform X1 [Scyliorhinus canicula]